MLKQLCIYARFVYLFCPMLFQWESTSACANLTPNFTISNSGSCLPRTVTLTNTSTGTLAAGSTYIWKINGAIIDTISGTGGLTYTINTPGTYTFRMVATTAGNCKDSISKNTTITTGAPRVQDGNGNPSYAPVFQNCITFITSPDSFQLIISPVDTLKTYTINWGDGTANTTGASLAPSGSATHTYATLGNYTFYIRTVNGGCSDTIFGTVINNRIPTAGIIGPPAGQNSGCAPHAVRFINNSSNTSSSTYFRWTYGDGSVEIKYGANDTVFHTYPRGLGAGGCGLTVTLEAINSCGTSQTTWNPVNIYDIDDAIITTANPNLCTPNQTFTLVNASANNCIPGTRYFYWDFGDGSTLGWTTSRASQTKSYPVGSYPVMLVDSNGCGRDTTYLNIIVNKIPTATFDFNKASGCAPLTVNFHDTSTGLLNTFAWNFGDPTSGGANTSTLRNPSHTFNQQGVFPVRLTVSNYCGTNAKTDTIRAYGKPNVQISNASSGCAPLATSFTNTTLYTSNTATYFWDMGDGTTAITKNAPSKTYNTPGTYTIKLKITDTCGTDSSTRSITVFNVPVAKFGANRVCAGDTTRFTDSSTVVMGDTITAWLWNFGDATTSTQKNPKKIYSSSGTYTVILRVTTQNGCIDYDTLNVTVDVSPVVSFTRNPVTVCDKDLVTYTGSATTSIGTITSYLYNLGTGQTAVSKDTSYTYPSPGKYYVNFTAGNSFGCSRTYYDSVTINPNPVAGFSFTPACLGNGVIFTDTSLIASPASISTRQWDFDNNGTIDQTGTPVTKVFAIADTFHVRLKVISNSGCIDQDTQNVIVRPLPLMNLAANSNSLCKNDSFVFTNTTTGASQFSWNFGDGSSVLNTSTTGVQKKNYAAAGTYTTKLIATTSFGCLDSATQTVIARPLPDAIFTSNDTVSCAPKTFTFTNTSTNATTYRWLINGALSYTSAGRPDTTVNVAGAQFTVSLIAYNSFNCKPDTQTYTYRTLNNPQPAFTPSIDSVCGPATVSFTNNSLFSSSYVWTFGNGTTSTATNPSVTFAASNTQDTTYTVKLVATNAGGCKDSISKNIRVFPRPVAAFTQSKTDSCGPFPVQFVNQSNHKSGGTIANMTFNWNFGNGNSSTLKDPSATFTASLTKDTVYTVRLIGMSRYGCRDTAYNNVRVYPNPKSIFSQSKTDSCGPLSVQFTNASVPNDTGSISIMSFNWNMGNGTTSSSQNASASYVASSTKDTVYTVRLVAVSEHGCRDTSYKTVRIYPKPLALFTQNTTVGCPTLFVQFTNQSTPKDTGNINMMTFNWNFGNGVTSSTKNNLVGFSASATQDTTYNVKLVAYSEHGCVDSTSKIITVHPKPIVKFNQDLTSGCYPLNVSFTNTTINGNSYFWDFGDGNTSTGVNSSHTFMARPLFDTTYNIKLFAISPFGCPGDTFTKQITVRYNPVADFFFDPDTGCGNTLTRLYNTSLGAISYSWILGEGSYTTAVNPFAVYPANLVKDTSYKAKMYAYTPYGCIDSAEKSILIAPLPLANFTGSLTGCHPFTTPLNGLSSNRAVSYQWDFGDGFTSTQANPTHTFSNPSLIDVTYRVILKVLSDKGCEDTMIRIVTVHPNPSADFTFTKVPSCDTASFTFSNTSINAVTYNWNFGDGFNSTLTNPQHYFRTSVFTDTTYLVKLIGISAFGCRDTIEKSITANPLVISDFSGTPIVGCEPHTANFTNLSRNGIIYFWDFGDGGASTSSNPSHMFLLPGYYTIKLVSIDKFGCSDTITKTNYIQVLQKPRADFIPSPQQQALPNSTVYFNNTSVSASPLSYLWDFGDSYQSTLKDPQHTYLDSGTYKVKLRVDNGQCLDSVYKNIRIDPLPPVADFDAIASGCAPLQVVFNNKSTNAYEFDWYIEGNVLHDKNPVYIFTKPGTYSVTLRVKGPGGSDDTTKTDYITVEAQPRANFRVNPKEVFLPDAFVDLLNLSTDAVKFYWYILDKYGNTVWSDTSENPRGLVKDTGYYHVKLIAVNAKGCFDTMTIINAFSAFAKGEIYVPTAFTPDRNGLNDLFKPTYYGLQSQDYHFIIFNRWGEVVFETTDRDAAWDGKFKGMPAQQDVYAWLLKGTLAGNKRVVLNGTVTLLH